MRIAVNTRFLLKGRLEGIGWYTHEVMRRLVSRHPEHEFIFYFDRPFHPDFIFGSNVRGVVASPPARHYVLWWWWYEQSLPRLFRRHQVDVFFSPDGYCSLRSRIPTLMVTHDIAHVHYPEQIPGWARHYYHRYVPLYLQRADHIVTVSEFVKQDIQQQYGIAPQKMTVAGNAAKEMFRPVAEDYREQVRREYAEGKPYFFYIGAMHPRKNLERLIRAFSLFKDRTGSELKLLLGGRPAWQSTPIREAWQGSPYQTDIVWLGYIADEKLPDILGSALALTYVSMFEGFGVPLLEAMHAEVPIITSRVSSLPEVAGSAALLIDPLSEAEIAGAMEKMVADQALRQRLIEAGRQQRAGSSWDKTADTIWKALEKLVYNNAY